MLAHIDYGLSVLTATVARSVPAGDGRSIWRPSTASCGGGLAGYEVTERFYEIGSPEGLADLERKLAQRLRSRRQPPSRNAMTSYSDNSSTRRPALVAALDPDAIERSSTAWRRRARRGGRLFFLGVGGSAGNAARGERLPQARGFEAYAPTDNVSELTARTNDEGWDTVFAAWLRGQPAARRGRAVRVLGRRRQPREEHQPEPGARARLAREVGAAIVGVVGRDGGYTATVADACVIVPTVNPDTDHAARRGVPGGRLAPAGVAPGAQERARPSGRSTRRRRPGAPSFSIATA